MDEKKIEYNPAWGICKPIRNNVEYEIAKIICKATHKKELKHCEIQCNVDCINYGKAIKDAGYRKESDTAREILTELKPIIINYLEEYMVNGREEAPKYFESLCKKYGVDLGE